MCKKGVYRLNDDTAWPTCELEAALLTACFAGGEITTDIATRIGRKEKDMRYVWQCTEVEWTEEWKVEFRRRRPEPCDHKTAVVISDTEAVCTWGCGQTFPLQPA